MICPFMNAARLIAAAHAPGLIDPNTADCAREKCEWWVGGNLGACAVYYMGTGEALEDGEGKK